MRLWHGSLLDASLQCACIALNAWEKSHARAPLTVPSTTSTTMIRQTLSAHQNTCTVEEHRPKPHLELLQQRAQRKRALLHETARVEVAEHVSNVLP